MHETLEYAERSGSEKAQTSRPSTHTDRPSSDAGRYSMPMSSIMATAGSAAGAAFLGGALAGPVGILGGALIGTALGVLLQKSHKK